MLVKIKRLTKAGQPNQDGYYLNNLEEAICEFIYTYNISEYRHKIITFNDEYIVFNIFDKEEAQIILNNIGEYRVAFKCIGELDTDEISEDTMIVNRITHLEIRKVV